MVRRRMCTADPQLSEHLDAHNSSLADELRQRPDMISGFRNMFNVGTMYDGGARTVTKDMVEEHEGAKGESSGGSAFTVRGERFLVVRRTWNSCCMVSKFRREGLVVCHLPAGMMLVCSFRRPVLAQQAVLAVEKVCALLWR